MVVDLFVELTCGLLYYYIGRICQILLEFFLFCLIFAVRRCNCGDMGECVCEVA